MSFQSKRCISEVDELKLIYADILDGYSFDSEINYYIKHFTEKDTSLILRKREHLSYYYASEGVPHESDLLKAALDNEEWSQEQEDKILELKYMISDNERNIHNIIPEQRGGIAKAIEDTKGELSELIFERKQILGRNIEDLVDDDVNDYVLFLSFFKDPEFKHQITKTYEEFQEYDTTKVTELNTHLALNYRKFSEASMKGIAVLPMFLNKLGYSKEHISTFFGKPIIDLTHNQHFLLSFGIRNLNILENAKGSPPDLSLDAKVSDLVKWYDIQQSLNIGRKSGEE